MLKTANIILFISAFLLLNTALALANDVVELKYIFSDQFFSGENPLGKEIDPDMAKAKEAVLMACKAWEVATGGSVKFTPANNPEGADIIFEGWSKRGPGVSIQDEMLCLDENDIGNLFSEYMPEALGFTIFDDCNSNCRFPESWDPADANNDHRARIFFHKKTAPWFCVLDEEKVLFDEAQRDVIRVAMREIGHALGFCEYPDGDVNECGLTPPCIRDGASIMCKNQVRCLQEVQDGPVPLGGMDDMDHPGVRDLARFDKESVLKKFFPGTKILYGRVQDADGNPIPEAVLSTEDGKFFAGTNSNGIYSLWHIVPGTYFIKVHHPEYDQDVAEIIAVSPAAPDMIIKDFKFTKGSQVMHGNTRVVPSVGGPDDIFTIVATFPGAFDKPPGSAKLLLDGQLVNEVSIPFITGPPPHVFSYYGLTGLKPGEHYYEFKVAQREGDRQQTLNGSFKVSRPSGIRFAVESSPSIVSVGKDNHATVSARLEDKNGEPLAGETVRFQTSFPGFFTPSSGEVMTNAQGLAEIIFTPGSSGNATITAVPPDGPSVTTSISCTSRPISIALKFHSAGKNSFKVISGLDYFTDKRPVAGEAVKWRLQPSEGCTWKKGPDQKTNRNGKAFGTFTIETDESRRVSVTTTHIPTGISGTGSFVFGGSERVQIHPARNLGKATEPCEWSTNGFFAVRHTNGSGLSIYRVSDWRKVWSKKRRSGKYHSFSFSPNGKKLAAGVFKDKDEIAVLNVPAGKVDDVWDASVEGESKTTDRSFVWKGSDIYAIQNDNVIRKWSVSGSLEMDFTHDAEIEEFRFNPAVDSQFAALDKNGVMKIWDKNSAAPAKTVKVESFSTGRLKCLAWSRDGKKLVAGSGIGDTGVIYIFDTSSWSKSGFDSPGLGNVNSLDYNNDSSMLAVGHDKGLMVLNSRTYSVEYYNTAATNHVRWNSDGSMLAAGGQVYVFNDSNFNGPKIHIAAPQSNAFFSGDSTEIKGKITGLHKIRSAGVSVNGGEPGALVLGSDGAFKKKISLKDGQNTFLIQTEDFLKNTASFSMTVGRQADSTPPALTEPNVGSAIGVKGTQVHFSIRVLDGDSGIDTSKVTAGTRLPEGDTGATVQLYDDGNHGDKEPGDGLFANWWNSSEGGEGFHAVDFYAVDRAGNTGSLEGGAKIFVYDRPAIKKPYLSTTTPLSKEPVNVNAVITDTSGVQSADLLYSTDAGRSWNRVDMSSAGTTYIGTIPPQGAGTVYYKIKALDLHGFDSETGSYAYIVRDDTGPMISIQQPSTTAAAFTSEPFILVSGRAADIDGPGLKSVTCSSGAANTGTIEAWLFRVPLNKGINPITVVAESLNGKLAIDSIEVTYAPKLAAPSFSPDVPHIFTDPVSVAISTPDKGAIIRYTTDNTDPTEASPGITSPILIAETTTIKARAYMPGWTPSDKVVGTFTLKKKTDVVKAASPPKEKTVVKSE